ncbi:hypothetical protein PR003_g26306 [Phytophthora rubi]|uniref:Uncharacterized protein n=1 Tax=Phytophthora rubi TaxID=129364 RepID=A0A6A4CGR4_9STRA|nr:hypothetical protein PR002_g24995 [Phytophthora rubi]KAE9286494.1 hypothetical protein PR003_g26306 [Phytophthora rubi]
MTWNGKYWALSKPDSWTWDGKYWVREKEKNVEPAGIEVSSDKT